MSPGKTLGNSSTEITTSSTVEKASTPSSTEPTSDKKDEKNGDSKEDSKDEKKDSPKPPPKPRGSSPTLVTIETRTTRDGEQKTTVILPDSTGKIEAEEYAEHALIIRRSYDKNAKLEDNKLEINSPYMLEVLEGVVKYCPAQPSHFKEQMTLDAPYVMLFHHWGKLEEVREGLEREIEMKENTKKETSTQMDEDVKMERAENGAVTEEKTMVDKTKEKLIHLNALLDLMNRELGSTRLKSAQLVDSGFITFKLLWTIFRPGSLVIIRGDKPDLSHSHVQYLDKFKYKKSQCWGPYFELHLSGTNSDGVRTGRAEMVTEILERDLAEGGKIRRLTVFPMEFMPQQERERVIKMRKEHGEQFLEMTKKKDEGVELGTCTVQRYSGTVQMLKLPPYMNWYSVKEEEIAGVWVQGFTEGRIITDIKTFVDECPTHDPKIFEFNSISSSDDLQPTVEECDCCEPSNSSTSSQSGTRITSALRPPPPHATRFWAAIDPLLCPPYICGFSPSLKKWCRFYLDQIMDPAWQADAFDRLILPPAPKKVIKSLVTAHEYPTFGSRDQQAAKGKGLVVLLHGAPGTGKTLTAESVAEHTRRPLLTISSGELGTFSSEIDHNMTQYLQYATLWRAIVLIDEADVFLEARKSGTGVYSKLEQNALVAIFLKQLEYFRGIVFLTSNRGSELDPAIKSRIHLFLRFDNPDTETRMKMWRQILRSLKPEELALPDGDGDEEYKAVLDIVKGLEMNGREIANAVNTMRTLAREEGGKVTLETVKTFIEVWVAFEEMRGDGVVDRLGNQRIEDLPMND